MGNLVFEILASMSILLGEPMVAQIDSATWSQPTAWQTDGDYLYSRSESTVVPQRCAENPMTMLVSPFLIQGIHNFYLDGKLVYSSLRKAGSGAAMNNSAIAPCYLFTSGQVVTWEVRSTTTSYSKIESVPEIVESLPVSHIISQTVPAATAVVLLVLGVLMFTLFHTTNAGAKVNIPFLFANLLAGAHFALTVPEAFGVSMPDILLHKLHDIALWLGTALLWIVFMVVGSAPKILQRIQLGSVVLAVTIILISENLSQSQVGSTIAFLSNILMFLGLLFLEVRRLFKNDFAIKSLYRLSAVSIFALSGIADLLTHLGAWDMVPLYAVGYVGAMVFLAILINDEITATYRERDHLRKNLELEVADKTKEIKNQAEMIETAYNALKNAKADALQAAKLASLGTLSAGIAHEINNSLNYVNGSLPPLKAILAKEVIADKDREKSGRLIGLMEEGLDLTFEIIRNLKSHAASRPSEIEGIALKKLVDGTLLLLKSKLNNSIDVLIEIPQEIEVAGNHTGMTQVVMNLLGNAIDAVESNPKGSKLISVKVTAATDDKVTVEVSDDGVGMDEAVSERIFDPFFTTKPEDKGTGLGLHIVRNEIEKCSGKIHVRSELGKGTTFSLELLRWNGQEKTLATTQEYKKAS